MYWFKVMWKSFKGSLRSMYYYLNYILIHYLFSKNLIHQRSDVEINVLAATSNEPCLTQTSEILDIITKYTFDYDSSYFKLMSTLWSRLSDCSYPVHVYKVIYLNYVYLNLGISIN